MIRVTLFVLLFALFVCLVVIYQLIKRNKELKIEYAYLQTADLLTEMACAAVGLKTKALNIELERIDIDRVTKEVKDLLVKMRQQAVTSEFKDMYFAMLNICKDYLS